MRDLPGTAQRLAAMLDSREKQDGTAQFAWQRADGEVVTVEVVGPLVSVKGTKKGEVTHNLSFEAESFEVAVRGVQNLMQSEEVRK